jgi:3-deoxy-D-manno-octulosonic-acid transferase
MARPPGLIAYLSVAALNAPAERRRISGAMARGAPGTERLAERLGQASRRRPEGRLVWLHAAGPAQEGPLIDIGRRLIEEHPDDAVLLTSPELPVRAETLPEGLCHQIVPNETSDAVGAFLDHWRPDICLWAGATLRPALIHAAAERDIPLHLIDATGPPAPLRGWPGWTGLTASTLRAFGGILATDPAAAEALVAAGAPKAVVAVAGPLEEDAQALACDMRERDSIGAVLKARPVWLAADVGPGEVPEVLAAHRAVLRLAHRLLLILQPRDMSTAAALRARVAAEGFTVALRSLSGEPEAGDEVFVADLDGELGLWFRLAPVSFMGCTLDPGESGGRSPGEPAALGSAILHGPNTGPHAGLYARLSGAEATRLVTDASSLAEAVAELLSPDSAAAMAHAAWRVSTGGAETNERVLAIAATALDRLPAS